MTTIAQRLRELLAERILILDGAMGTAWNRTTITAIDSMITTATRRATTIC